MRLNLRRVSLFRRLMGDERGQNIALAAMLLLFVSLAVMLTFAIGYRTREKIKLQALADSGAYSIAVTEARLFNYFAWANRTHAAHDVAILSIHSHASYISFMEGLYQAGKDALQLVEVEMAAWCIPCIDGVCCESCENASKFGDAADEYWGSKTFEGKWLHDKWHSSDTYDKQLMGANTRHYSAIKALYKEQQDLMKLLATSATAPKLLKTMPEDAAKAVDPDIKSGAEAAKASATTLYDAISWGPSEDWKEIVSATRANSWVYKRSFSAGGGWLATVAYAEQKLMPCFHIPSASDDGNAKTTKAASSFNKLQTNIHKNKDDKDGWGHAKGYGAEDHGGVDVFGMCDCPGYGGGSANGGVISGPTSESVGYHFYFHATSEKKKAESSTHDVGGCNGPAGDDDPDGGGDCGVYYRHPRYKYGETDLPENKVWGHPHPVVVLTKENKDMIDKISGKKYPFEFDVNLTIPVPVHFQTLGNQGDVQSGNTMAAIAGALVYYHKPSGGGSDNWQEPPTFWNPFWRAKLHPLKGNSDIDARAEVLKKDHPKSSFPANSFIRY